MIKNRLSWVYTSLLHVHLLRLHFLIHLLGLLFLGLGLFLGSWRSRRGGWWRGWFAHDLLDLVVHFSSLILDLLGSDNQILPFSPCALLLIRGSHPRAHLFDEGEAFLTFFGSDMFVLLILNRGWFTSELRRVVLLASESPKIFTSCTN